MDHELDSTRPEFIKENWDRQFEVLPWMAYITAIPHVLYVVTTVKEGGQPNTAFQGWSAFSGEGDNFYVIMSGIMKETHTYKNIMRDKQFCVNFLSANYIKSCEKTIEHNDIDEDEIAKAGFTAEESKTIQPMRIKESFLKLECEYEWERDLCPNSTNATICGKVKHLAVSEEFSRSSVAERYGDNSFMFHLMSMKDAGTGEDIPGAIGKIEVSMDIDL